jgi:uncharacterized membrane protein YeaQ/YmgE (transglycosylase-associated protein family)
VGGLLVALVLAVIGAVVILIIAKLVFD